MTNIFITFIYPFCKKRRGHGFTRVSSDMRLEFDRMECFLQSTATLVAYLNSCFMTSIFLSHNLYREGSLLTLSRDPS
jgi:hypothetical protein